MKTNLLSDLYNGLAACRWQGSTDCQSVVRKLFLSVSFAAFDLPDTTVVAPQALMLLNSDEGVRYAKSVADRLTATTPLDFDNAERTAKLIDSLFQRTLVRSSTADERSRAVDFLRRHRAAHAKTSSTDQAAHRALVDLCRAVLNLNEFAYID